MKKLTFLSSILYLSFLISEGNAQTQVAYFKDSTVIEYEVTGLNTEDRPSFQASINGRLRLASDQLGLQYFNPNIGMFTMTGGFGGIGLEGIYFLGSQAKTKSAPLTLRASMIDYNTMEQKIVTVDQIRRTYFGPHASITYMNFGQSPLFFKEGLSAVEISLGGALTRGRYLSAIVLGGKKPKKIQFSKFMTFNADVNFYVNRKLDQSNRPAEQRITAEEYMRNTGFKVYWEGGMGFGKSIDQGFTILIGFETLPYKDGGSAGIFGLGYYVRFL
ncbi:MAG: hypothetical protein ACJATA_000621 [Sphingobacteriales bacterium]|jgi:hypothetical protein